MSRKTDGRRSFEERDEFERTDLLAAVWCDTCDEPDLGLEDPVEYEEHGFLFLEGKCLQCGEEVVTRIESLVEN